MNIYKVPSARTTGLILKCVTLALIYFSNFPTSAQQMLWGVASEGGESGIGSIFMTNADGTGLEVKKSLQAVPGRSPSYTTLIQTSTGKIYGMTGWGGAYLKGVLFEYNPSDGSYNKKYDFNGIDGAHPYGGLTEVNGKLYGLTSVGGNNGKGVLFVYDPIQNNYEKKFDFGGLSGEEPYSDLVVTPNGNLYGVTYSGGANSYGVIFKYDTKKSTFTKKKDFDGSAGRKPFGGLLLGSSGQLYGMASQGQANLHGTIYAYDTATNVITKKFDFSGIANGSQPLGRLIQATNGLMYGMTVAGGSNNRGVLFEYNPGSGAFTKKIDFENSKGLAPYGSLFQASDGKLYGTTEQGIAGFGGIFQYDISSGNYAVVVTLDGTFVGKGGASRATLMQASDGKLYGMNSLAGLGMRGVLFSYNPINNDYQVKVNFEFDNGAGMWPYASLVQGSNGKLYGTTFAGGANRSGVLFEFDITKGIYTKKFDFDISNGTTPAASMMLASNNKLYGVTRYGGAHNAGVIFEYDPSLNIYSKKIDFQSSEGSPDAALIQIPNGKMYGVAAAPSAFSNPILFEYDPASNAFAKKVDFNGPVDGNTPGGALLYADGKIYGLMRYGGANNKGTLFEYDPATGMMVKLRDFSGTSDGAGPTGSLVKAQNNKLYGVTELGGSINAGTIFEYDPATGSFNKKFDFTDALSGASNVQSGLVESSNGKLYGATYEGGSGDFGMIYEFDIESSAYTKKHDFKGIDGATIRTALIFVSMEEQTVSFGPLEEKAYGDDPFTLNATATSGLPVTYTSSNPAVATVNGNTVTLHGGGTTTITASQSGSRNFHSASAAQTLTVTQVLAADDPYKTPVILYPNPSRHEFFMNVAGDLSPDTSNLLVYDYLGRSSRIQLEKVEDGKYRCSTTQLAAGLHFVFIPGQQKPKAIMIVR